MDKMDAALKKHASEHGEELRTRVKALMARRGQLKRVITVTLKTINKGGYDVNVIQQQVENIKGKLKEVEEHDCQIMTELQEHGIAEEDSEVYEEETKPSDVSVVDTRRHRQTTERKQTDYQIRRNNQDDIRKLPVSLQGGATERSKASSLQWRPEGCDGVLGLLWSV